MMKLLRMLIVRPLTRDPARTALTLSAVALGIAVVVAINLAVQAATGSFTSSLGTVAGKNDLEITATGGIEDKWMGVLTALPINARFEPSLWDSVEIGAAGYVTVYGVDFVGKADAASGSSAPKREDCKVGRPAAVSSTLMARLPTAFWIGSMKYCRAATIASAREDFVAIDIADFEQALNRYGKLDSIAVTLDAGQSLMEARDAIRRSLPAGLQVEPRGTRTAENDKMLSAFRWNLRILSYIALVVGAFLIYNTISISVVRRRAEIGILRAIGAAREMVFALFVGEALLFGIVGAALGLLFGRVLAEAVVGMISRTVNELYVTSRPAPIEMDSMTVLVAFLAGIAVAAISGWGPAREATRIAPVEAMGRGSRETRARLNLRRDLVLAAVLAVAGVICARQEPLFGKPLFGYAAGLAAIGAVVFVAPGLIAAVNRGIGALVQKLQGAAGLLASRGLARALRRTSVVASALAAAVAMMASVAIMVGSFRETVIAWLNAQLRADLYVRAAGPDVAGEFRTISRGVAAAVRNIPGVAAIDQFTAINFSYDGQRATLGAGDLAVQARYARMTFLAGNAGEILKSLQGRDRAIVSEPFARKHAARVGDVIRVPIGDHLVALKVAGIYYDYSSEQGFVVIDASTLHRYLPDRAPTSLAIYLSHDADRNATGAAIRRATRIFPVDLAYNSDLRRDALTVFDRTFAITWALEAIAIFVAILGAANALLALVLDRRREIGMLRYLGAAEGQIRRMILVEAALLGLFAVILGVPLGLILSLLLIYVINRQSFGWTIHFHPPMLVLTAALVFVWVATVLSGLYPARVAARLKPVEVTHEE